jgi:hypothetical protein
MLRYLEIVFLPRTTLVWWLALLMALPVTLLASKELVTPMLNNVGAMASGEGLSLPLYYFVKLFCFMAISIPALLWCQLNLTYHYHTSWAGLFHRPHALHCDFHPHPDYSYWALLRWYGFRLLRLVLPFAGGCLMFAVLLALEVALFNLGFDSALLRLPIPFIVGLALLFFVGFFLLILGFVTLYQGLTSCYGTPAALCEPLKPPSVLMERSKRIALMTPWFWAYTALHGAWWLVVLVLVTYVLFNYQLIHLLQGKLSWGLCALVEVSLSVVMVGLNFLRFFAYHQSLSFYYDRLPSMIKQTYSPPPSFVQA